MDRMTEWWLNYKPLTQELLNKVNTVNDDLPKYGNCNWEDLVEKLRNKIPLSSSTPRYLYVNDKGRTFIDELFKKYMDDDTLLITSSTEHEAVVKNINQYNLNDVCVKINPNQYYDIIPEIKKALSRKQYKKVFVYIIGTNLTTGRVTPQQYFIDIKQYLTSINMEHKITIDDVHGMFIIPRDYSIFDYILYTAHVLTRKYEMGMLWSKTEENFGYKYDNLLNTYIDIIDIMLERVDKLKFWRSTMINEFNNTVITSNGIVQIVQESAPHIFTLRINCPPHLIYNDEKAIELEHKEIKLDNPKDVKSNFFYIRLRGSAFITFPELLEDRLNIVNKIIEKALFCMNTIGV